MGIGGERVHYSTAPTQNSHLPAHEGQMEEAQQSQTRLLQIVDTLHQQQMFNSTQHVTDPPSLIGVFGLDMEFGKHSDRKAREGLGKFVGKCWGIF